MEIHVVVVAAAVVADEAHATGQIRGQRTTQIEAEDALLVGVRLGRGGGRELVMEGILVAMSIEPPTPARLRPARWQDP